MCAVEGTEQEIGSLELRALLDLAARPEPGVGAGSMAAVCVAVAASLVAKSARASRDVWPEARAVAAQAGVLATRALRLAELDAEAFQAAIGVLRPTGENVDEGRDDLIAAALTSAAYLPLRIASVAADVAILGATAREGGSAGDLEPEAVVGALLGGGGGPFGRLPRGGQPDRRPGRRAGDRRAGPGARGHARRPAGPRRRGLRVGVLMTYETAGDAEVVAACRAGDQDAWRELVRRFSRYVHAIATQAYRLGTEDAEDVFQEVFARTWSNLDHLRDDEAIRPWIGQLTRRLCLDRLRRERHEDPIERDRSPIDRRDRRAGRRHVRARGAAAAAGRARTSSTASSAGTRATSRSLPPSACRPARSPAASPAASGGCATRWREDPGHLRRPVSSDDRSPPTP